MMSYHYLFIYLFYLFIQSELRQKEGAEESLQAEVKKLQGQLLQIFHKDIVVYKTEAVGIVIKIEQ